MQIMGRTKRRRLKKDFRIPNISYDEDLVSLQKWLTKNGWKNYAKLKIKTFVETGRGITSKNSILPNDVLISMPMNLLITYRSIQINFSLQDKFTIQELLAFFLILEKKKNIESRWYEYIRSLPKDTPSVPWLATEDEIKRFPVDLCLIAETSSANFKSFLDKVKRSIINTNFNNEDSICEWAYVMVNTRAVYVDPNLFSEMSSHNLLDQPSMALCPFLDMFNHHYLAQTEVNIVQNEKELVFQLKSLTKFKKNKQIFISYGQHDNTKLLMEYGFFLPGNIYDTIKFEFEDILKILKFNIDHNRYKFIKEHNFHNNLYIGYNGESYCLKIVLLVPYIEESRYLDSIIFSDDFPDHLVQITLPRHLETLLDFKKELLTNQLFTLANSHLLSDSAKTVVAFVEYQIQFIDDLKIKLFT